MHLTVKNSFDSKTKQATFEQAQCLSDMETIPAVQHDVFSDNDKVMGLRTECRHVNNKVKLQVFHNYSKIIASCEMPKNCTPNQLLATIHNLILKKTVGFTWDNSAEIIEKLYQANNIDELPNGMWFTYSIYVLGRKITNYRFHIATNDNNKMALFLFQDDDFIDEYTLPDTTSPEQLPIIMEEFLWEEIGSKTP